MWNNFNLRIKLLSLCGNDLWKRFPHDNQQSLVEIVKRGMCVTESGE